MFSRIGMAGVLAFCAAGAISPVSAAQARLEDGASLAHLEQPLGGPVSKIIDGRQWECAGDTCRAAPQAAAQSQPLSYECRNAAQALGRFKDYQTGSDMLKPAQLAACNGALKPALRAGT